MNLAIDPWRTTTSMQVYELVPWPDALEPPVLADGTPHPQIVAGVQAFVDKCEATGLHLAEDRDIRASLAVAEQTGGRVTLVILAWFDVEPRLDAAAERLVHDAEHQARNN